jgi:preprotein translocase subunit Sec63
MIRILFFLAVIGVIYWMFKSKVVRPSAMSAGEASKVLGVSDSAGADEVIAAHKKLIAKVHPDSGGSAELASRVNQARDVLLARISKA